MATGGTVDYSSICLVVALHKTPRYAVVKKSRSAQQPHELVIQLILHSRHLI